MTNAFLETIWKTHLEGKAWQVKDEFLGLLQFCLDNKVKNVLEIGTHKGGSALGFLMIGCNVTSVDVVKLPEVEVMETLHKIFKFYQRDQYEDMRSFLGHDIPEFDLLFIDGDHSYEHCKKDYEQFSPLIKPGGFVVFHDVLKNELHEKQECEVWKVIQEIHQEKSFDQALRVEGSERYSLTNFIKEGAGWGGITILKV